MDRIDSERSVYVGNLHSKATVSVLYDLFVQVGPVTRVLINTKKGTNIIYAFVEFDNKESVQYTCDVMSGLNLYGQPMQIRPMNSEGKPNDKKNYSRKSDYKESSDIEKTRHELSSVNIKCYDIPLDNRSRDYQSDREYHYNRSYQEGFHDRMPRRDSPRKFSKDSRRSPLRSNAAKRGHRHSFDHRDRHDSKKVHRSKHR